MKNQYFCDVIDYTKYAILRKLHEVPKSIYWTLTSNDNGTDGRRLEYLDLPKTSWLDSELWNKLNQWVKNDQRKVSLIEPHIPNLKHIERRIIDNWNERVNISNDFIKNIESGQLVFLDPDNGFEIPSCKKGRSKSCKYVYGGELTEILNKDCIVMLYQHKKKGQSVDDMVIEFSSKWKESYQFSVITSYVVYYFLANNGISWIKDKICSMENNKPHTKIDVR